MPAQTEQPTTLGGRYRLAERIGYGGMARVYRATDELLDRPVAIKLLEQPSADMPEMAEARAAARLSHPGVVHVFDVGVSDGDGHGYIVMELVPGESLAQMLREQGKLPPDEAAELAAQVADALEAIHRHDMVHCDVKPLNIIVTPSGHTKLVDFGIARVAAAGGEAIGSAAYVSPEQARGEPVDARTDVYPLGAVLCEMLAGKRPFSGPTTTELVRSRLLTDPPPLRSVNPAVSRDLETIVMRALARDPADRFSAAGEMRDALREVVSRAMAPTQAIEPVTLPLRLPHVPIRRPLQLRSALKVPRRGAAAVAVAIAICALAITGWRVTHPPNAGVPHLVGLALSDVPTALEAAGMPPADVTVLTRQVESRYVGTVVDQQPQPGTPRNSADGLQIAVGVAQ